MVKEGKELPESSILEFTEMIWVDNFTLRDDDETSGSWIRQQTSDSPLIAILENSILVVFTIVSHTVIFSLTKIGYISLY